MATGSEDLNVALSEKDSLADSKRILEDSLRESNENLQKQKEVRIPTENFEHYYLDSNVYGRLGNLFFEK